MRAQRLLSRALRVQRRDFSASSRRSDVYAFIGLGRMGFPMAKNLQSKLSPSDSVRLFDINTETMTLLAEEFKTSKVKGAAVKGAAVQVTGSLSDAVRGADTVITALPNSRHVKGVYTEILGYGNPTPRLFIDCSTIDPITSGNIARWFSEAELGHFVDAPMSGGVVGAEAGTLTFMLGSAAELVPTVEPILLRMGKRVLHCGKQGTGLAAKIANNYILVINNIATAEAMHLGMQLGVEAKVLADVINTSTGHCWPSEVNNPVPGVVESAPASRDYVGGYTLSLAIKDLNAAVKASNKSGATLRLASPASSMYQSVSEIPSCHNKDFSVVYRYISRKDGIKKEIEKIEARRELEKREAKRR
ncbi:NAD binding domain of 6-phosphogluconate dehydrogenase-domain-containing protein [Xylaria sp. CBS 124048]|nr:NAD binding domain of 6-phosphogluconate dehydrogenase-domain-containing protein [Xylaria sp. CBS 124048]